MNIKGGALEFDIIANNGQINKALEESKKRVQGFTDATVEGGQKMEAAYEEAAETIEKAFRDIDVMSNLHHSSIVQLENEYTRLGEAAGAAFMKGTAKGDEEYRSLTQKQQAIKQEITMRKKVVAEIETTADALGKEEQRLIEEKKKVDEAAAAHTAFRTQLRNVREEMLKMEAAGKKDTIQYRELEAEAGRLAGAIANVNKQTQLLGHNQASLQGVISAISGITGAFSAAQGAVGLFAGENENLQKIMVKVQSLMAITIGLQQVSQALHEKSAFSLIVLSRAKNMVSTSTLFLGKAFIRMGLSATAAKVAVAGLYATLTLGLSLAITGIVHLINKHNQKQEEAKRKAEELAEASKKQKERLESLAKSYAEQVALITTLRNALANETYSYNDKLRIIKKLQEIIPDYNAKISKEGDIIWENKAAIDAYLVSLEKTLKFKAAMEDLTAVYAEMYQLEKNAPKGSEAKTTINFNGQTSEIWDVNKLAQQHGLKDATDIPAQVIEQWKQQAETFDNLAKDLNNKRKEELNKQVADIQKYVQDNNLVDFIDHKKGGKGKKEKDPFIELLEERKKQYDQYFKWVNSKDEIIQQAAKTEFAGLLKQGSSYLDYLKNQREQIVSSVQGNQKEVGQKMVEAFGNGNVDLLARPIIEAAKLAKKGWEDAGDGIATVFSSQFGILDKDGKEVEILVTPILPDGSVLSPKELEDYIYNDLQGANDILEADKKGIVISVGVDSDGTAGEILHQLQEQYYATSKLSDKQRDVLRKLNDAIATETKETVLNEFEKDLQRQLNGARSILEMLNILEERRKKLAGDGSELDNGKKDILDRSQEEVGKQAETETKNLLDKYAGYLADKLEFDVNYLERKRLLTEAYEKATTEENKRIAAAALEGLENDRKRFAESSGNEDYDNLLKEYRSYSKKRADIAAEFDEKIALATEKGNEELVQRLTEAKNRAISSVALEELQSSGAWEKLFGNLDDLTTKQIEDLIRKIEGQRAQLGIELDPKDLEAILSKLEEAKNEIRSRNPFKALKDAIKDYGKATDDAAKKKSLTAVFESAAGSIDLVKGSFDSVVDGLNKMGLAGDEVTQQLLGDISEMLGSASQLATGIATGNPLSIIQGSIGLISSAFEVFNFRDRKAERAIKKHAEAVKELEGAYKALEYAVDNALGSSVYKNQQALIKNIQEQRRHLEAMWKEEQSKKKTDNGKVNEYKEQYDELGRQIEDILRDIREDILQTNAKTFANELGDAIVEAFGKGEDAAKAFEDTVNNVIKNAILNQLKKNFLETQLEGALDDLYNSMGTYTYSDETAAKIADLEQKIATMQNSKAAWIYKSQIEKYKKELEDLKAVKDNFIYDGLSQSEQDAFKNKVSDISDRYKEALKVYENLFKELDESDPSTTLSGAIKGASQESIDLLAGQTNAVRVNQVESIELLRQQLLHLASIDSKIGVSNKFLERIEQNTKTSTTDPLRSQGIA